MRARTQTMCFAVAACLALVASGWGSRSERLELRPEAASPRQETAHVREHEDARPDPLPRPGLILLATSVADPAPRSTVTLRDSGSAREETLRVGDTPTRYPEVAVAAIGRGWVELSDRRGSWRLEIAASDPVPVLSPRALQRMLTDPGLTPAERVEHLRAAGRGRQTLSNVLHEATFAPLVEDGRIAGLALTHVEPGGFYARLGLGAGDRLREVNGLGFDASEDFEAVVEALANERSLHLWVESEGELRRVFVDLALGSENES